jgi:L-ascorbate metabolism protein UlaG (beta-lactamase superfamily)
MRGVAAAAVAALLAAGAVAGPAADGGAVPAHHAADGFRNPDPGYVEKSDADFRRWRRERAEQGIPEADAYRFELARNDPGFLRANRTQNTATWIGHATVLLQIGGMNVLTDPQFSERASPVQWFGPRRAAPPGIALEDLPPIDLVVISHDHYDSLDRNTIRSLRRRPGGERTLFLAPLGLARWFRSEGIDNARELDWWETTSLGALQITATPAQHWSQRTLFNRNETLWSGWVIAAPGFRAYFAGDSGYAPLFREIGSALGPFDLALIPIGAYEPRWFMKSNHLNPEEAVLAHRDLRARRSLAIHWGTFVLSDEPLTDPPVKLGEALRSRGIPAEEFLVLRHGETRLLDDPSAGAPGS